MEIDGLLSFLLYLLAIFAIGFTASKRLRNSPVDVHLGGREHGAFVAVISSAASTESGFVLLGMVGAGFAVGFNAFWILAGGLIGYTINWFYLAPRLRSKSERLQAVTIGEFIYKATGGSTISRLASIAASLFITFFVASYAAAQFNATGKAFNGYFEIPFAAGALIGALIVTLYAVVGGFRAVSWTDVLQASMMFITLVVVPLLVINENGGWASLVADLGAIDPNLVDPLAGSSGVVGALTVILPWAMLGLAYPGQPHAIARVMATKERQLPKWAPIVSIAWFISIYSGAVALGVAARTYYGHVPAIAADPEQSLPLLAGMLMPGLISGLVVASIFAAIASTADSALYSASSSLTKDLLGSFGKKTEGDLAMMRAIIVLLATITFYMGLDSEGSIFTLVLFAWSGLGASIGPALLYCSTANRPSPVAALAGIIVGGCCAILIDYHPLDLLISFSVALAAIIGLHILLRRSQSQGDQV